MALLLQSNTPCVTDTNSSRDTEYDVGTLSLRRGGAHTSWRGSAGEVGCEHTRIPDSTGAGECELALAPRPAEGLSLLTHEANRDSASGLETDEAAASRSNLELRTNDTDDPEAGHPYPAPRRRTALLFILCCFTVGFYMGRLLAAPDTLAVLEAPVARLPSAVAGILPEPVRDIFGMLHAGTHGSAALDHNVYRLLPASRFLRDPDRVLRGHRNRVLADSYATSVASRDRQHDPVVRGLGAGAGRHDNSLNAGQELHTTDSDTLAEADTSLTVIGPDELRSRHDGESQTNLRTPRWPSRVRRLIRSLLREVVSAEKRRGLRGRDWTA